MKQLVSVLTRKLPPLQVDERKKGSDADNHRFGYNFECNTVATRPLPQSSITEFGKVITSHNWKEVLDVTEIDIKVKHFLATLRNNCDNYFPGKFV